VTVTTQNIRVFRLQFPWLKKGAGPVTVEIDGTKLSVPGESQPGTDFEKVNGKWIVVKDWFARTKKAPEKTHGQQGPIDDAFNTRFIVVGPDGAPWHPATGMYATAEQEHLSREWNKFFRANLPVVSAAKFDAKEYDIHDVVLFGDPASNPLIAKVLPKLPITWTKDELVVNGVKYDPKTHVPVLIYPSPLHTNGGYVVLNSGHTFKAADLNGTNALLYPRLGDWAVIKPTPTKTDPTAYEVVAAGLFDENWQFPKK
jgi:hypothetical protein